MVQKNSSLFVLFPSVHQFCRGDAVHKGKHITGLRRLRFSHALNPAQ